MAAPAPAEFRIHYADDSTYDDLDGPWHTAPQDGVVVVVVIERERVPLRGRWLASGTDFYVLPPGNVYPWATNDLQSMLVRAMGPSWIPADPWPPMDQLRRYLRTLIHPTSGLPMADYVKHGATVDHGVWQSIMEAAWSDPEIPAPIGLARRASDIPDLSEALERGDPQGPITPPFSGRP